jgi:hypothetical protein
VLALLRILVLISAGYVLACLAAGAFLVLAVIGADEANLTTWRAETLVLVLGVAAVAGGLGALPALAAIVAAEVFGWRSLLFHLVAGGGIGLAAHLLGPFGHDSITTADAQLFLATGCVGGLVYWLVAGRSAGLATCRP